MRGSWFGWPYLISGVVSFRGAVTPVRIETTASEGGSGAVSGAVERGFCGPGRDSG